MMITSFEKLSNREEVIVVDWDEIIQSLSIQWIINLLVNYKHFSNYIDIKQLRKLFPDIENIAAFAFNRKYYNVESNLGLYSKFGTDQEALKKFKDKFMKIYLDDEYFYEKAPFLATARYLFNAVKGGRIKEIHFLTHNIKENDTRKEQIFDKYFKQNHKFKFNALHITIPKSKFINENIPNWTTFIDDSIENLKDVFYNTENNIQKAFIKPLYGYNYLDSKNPDHVKFYEDIDDRGCVLYDFKQSMIMPTQIY